MAFIDPSAQTSGSSFLAGGGELGSLMRHIDWSQNPLGPVSQWPQALKTAVRIMLTSRQPMFVWWGDELINLYNDAYRSILGGKHPQALAQPASSVWREIWDQVGPRARSAIEGNEGTYDEALLLIMERNGYPEETYYTFSYSPVPNDEGGTGGILCANTEDTQRIVGERQLALLRELAARTADARTIEEACVLSAQSLATNARDLPFALIYLTNSDHSRVALAGACGIEPGHPAAPLAAELSGEASWPFAEILRTNTSRLITELPARFGKLPCAPWTSAPFQALAMPIAPSGQLGRSGILIAALNPFRLFDDRYEGFLALVSGQIAAAISNAQAYEEERKRAEVLAELDRAKTTFFSNVSHELRTPLTLLLGPVEDALGKPESQQEVAGEELRLVHRSGQRLLKLVNTLLDFSRLEAGRMEACYEPVDLSALTGELTSVFRSAFEKAGLQLDVSCETLLQPVYVDREMWEKIIFNLLSNAFKFTLEGGVRVSLRQEAGQVVLAVNDTGIGIPAGELSHIFERFHRVPAAKGRTFEGTGIGLALVHELVRLHGGEVSVESCEGRGSTFTIRIPLGKAHLPPERIGSLRRRPSSAGALPYIEEALRWLPNPEEPPSEVMDLTFSSGERQTGTGTKKRVLLADDNRDLRDYLTRLLSETYDVEAVANGMAALDAVRNRAPDLVLTDVMMPELDGFGLLQTLRADLKTRTIPVILLSARAGEEARVEGLEAGADDYLIKPFSARELLARVAAHIELARVRREADEALRASDARFRRLFEANIFGLMVFDLHGHVLEANDAYLQLIGYTREDLESGGIRCEQLTLPEEVAVDTRAKAELRERGVCTPYEKVYIRKDGTRVPILIGAVSPAEPYAEQETAIVFCLDLSERKRMDEQLWQTQKLESLGVLAGGVAHDFNNLLVGILGNASLALEDTPAVHPTRVLLEEVVHAAERAADLTKQMLAYAGKGRFVVERIDLSQRIREIAVLIQASVPKNVQLQMNLRSDLPAVEGDPSQLQQLIMNLIINGAEAMGEQNGVVSVSTGVQQMDDHSGRSIYSGFELRPGRYVFLEVRDSGCGMDEETKAKIFDPFFTTKFTGRGLGLAAALGIVRGHKGALAVQSAVGMGSTFRVLLPALDGSGAAHEPLRREENLTGNGLIFVVDDEDTVRRTVATTLQRYGYSVVMAENGSEAVERFRDICGRVAAVVLDMTMPVMGGLEALDQLKSISANVKVILSSGFSEAEALRKFTGKGLAGFIQKPYTAAQLAQKIKETIERC